MFVVLTVPGGVSPPVLEVANSSSLNASWTEPQHPNGVIISYSLHMRNLSTYSVLYQGSSLSYHVTGLSAGQEYFFYIMANTSVGGTKSTVVSASVPSENTLSKYPYFRYIWEAKQCQYFRVVFVTLQGTLLSQSNESKSSCFEYGSVRVQRLQGLQQTFCHKRETAGNYGFASDDQQDPTTRHFHVVSNCRLNSNK